MNDLSIVEYGEREQLLEKLWELKELAAFRIDLSDFNYDECTHYRTREFFKFILKDDHFLKYRKVEVIARKLGISRESLTRALKKDCGICPKEFITCMRHYLAAYFLARTQFPVKTIARKCKFDNERVFCKSFKSTIGLTATQFRSRYKWQDYPALYLAKNTK